MKQFDVVVLGGGPGGYVSAIRAAQLGKKVALIEKSKLGGTCLNRGCIPTKVLLHSAEIYHTVLHAAEFGVEAAGNYDYAKIAQRKDTVVTRLRGGVKSLVKGAGVELITGEGVLQAADTICVGDEAIHAKSIIIATGSEPIVPPILGANQPFVHTSDSLLELTRCPQSIVIVGGGVIGLEFATLISTFGAQVTVLEMLPTILTGMDGDVITVMNGVLKKSGITVHTGATVLEIREGQVLYAKDGQEAVAAGEAVLLATGRKPCTKGLGLEQAGIQLSSKGFVVVEETMGTNIPGVFAIGDCTGKVQLAHVASEQGLVAAHNAAGQNKRMHYDVIPACVYTTPEIASVGMTEQAAKEKGIAVKVGSFPVMSNGKSMIVGEKNGFAKLITARDTGEILGAHIISPRATDMIGEIAVAMRGEMTVEELCDTIHPHPTISEILMEAAHDVNGLCIHKPK